MLHEIDSEDVTDPFIDVSFENAKLAKTSVVLNDLNPRWNESFSVELCHWGTNLNFEVRDKDHAYAEYIGMVQIPGTDLVSSGISGNSNSSLQSFINTPLIHQKFCLDLCTTTISFAYIVFRWIY